jgi:hypothetical protein
VILALIAWLPVIDIAPILGVRDELAREPDRR